jgi:hypothetical protein
MVEERAQGRAFICFCTSPYLYRVILHFACSYIYTTLTEHHITAKYRWSPNQLNALEYASINYHLPINETTDKLKKKIMHLVRQQC